MIKPINMSQNNEGLDTFLADVRKEKFHTRNFLKLDFGQNVQNYQYSSDA
jgi:hypothetical protein